jgi:hypothetical protein
MLKKEKVDFCVRMKENWWLKVKEFSESGRKEQFVQFNLPKKDINLFEGDEELIKKPVRCRLISVTLENGEKEILCTSLTDRKKYIYDDFKELYHLRWNEEEAYKLLKSRAEIECFTGKTAMAVKQDFYAKIFAMSYCSLLAFPIEEKVRKEYAESKNKHPQKINRTNAFAMFREIGVALLLKGKVAKAIEAFDKNIFKTREIVRPGRSNERKKRPKRLHYMNYKIL